ncbi:VOC family protein [Modicisalibacter radicis]|uniref:VOC family protein n=1 Tax=Halomonas sp. EAR18 TaxID=2518972 RepID=UPI00109C06ED|nr:VOC family protein [Halomonas sp. EAR18]
MRVSDLESSRAWYEHLGLEFSEERHDDGPVHYAAAEANFVFEPYPESASNPVSSAVRLGFCVQDVCAIVDAKTPLGSVAVEPDLSSGRLHAVLVDPEGIKVEINEAKT